LSDFGTAKKIFSSKYSNNSVNSSESYISGMTSISAISGISRLDRNSNNSSDRVVVSEVTSVVKELEDLVGSEFYISPEMLETRAYSYSSDLWALGIMIYQFFTGKLPFKGKTQGDTFEIIKKCEYEEPKDIPEVALDLIKKLIVKTPELRIGA